MELDDYLRLPYTITLRPDDEGDWVARVQELTGCTVHGSTQGEALERLEEAKREWIQSALEHSLRVPEPTPEEPLPSGKWIQRVPRSLHNSLRQLAKAEGTSLNHLVTKVLSEYVGTARSSGHILSSGALVFVSMPVTFQGAIGVSGWTSVTSPSAFLDWFDASALRRTISKGSALTTTADLPISRRRWGKQMADPTQYVFSYPEIVEALIKKQNLHEGLWAIYMEFGIAGANVGPTPDQAVPTAIVPVVKVGLQRVDEDKKLPGTVDAALVNPAKT